MAGSLSTIGIPWLMSAWLDPVRRALDGDASSVTFFFRDDDAGWEDDKLFRLLDVVTRFDAPTALAAIPMAISAPLAAELRTLLSANPPVVSVHQHGYAHVNHETTARRSEFGGARARDQQRQDVANGRRQLQQLLGRTLPPIFTPPWNRCTRDTAACLVDLGFRVLSRDISAEPFDLGALYELPVRLDWSGRHGARADAVRWGDTIACAMRSAPAIGLMLHHAVMTPDERRMLGELLEVITERSNAVVRPMLDIAAAQVSGGIPSCVF